MQAPLSCLSHLLTRTLVFAHLPVSRGFPSVAHSVLGCGGLCGLWKTGKEVEPALSGLLFVSLQPHWLQPLVKAAGFGLALNFWFWAGLTRTNTVSYQ